jgi:hypothetical protein
MWIDADGQSETTSEILHANQRDMVDGFGQR